jgi:hypothetical protein
MAQPEEDLAELPGAANESLDLAQEQEEAVIPIPLQLYWEATVATAQMATENKIQEYKPMVKTREILRVRSTLRDPQILRTIFQ